MGSSYHGELNFGKDKGVRSNSRKGKKNSSEKPKQPQRGLGVAQLEKIRLHAQMGYSQNPSFYNNEDGGTQSAYSTPSYSSSSHGIYPNIMLGQGEYDQRSNIRYGDYQSSSAERWSPNNGISEIQNFMQPNVTLFSPHIEDSVHKNRRWEYTTGIDNSSDAEELDLELRLSL